MDNATDDIWDELSQSLDRELVALPDRCRKDLVLCALEGLDQQELAAQLGVRAEAALARVNGCADLLRARLAKRGIEMTVPALMTMIRSRGATTVPAMKISTIRKMALAGAVLGDHAK